MCKIVHYDRIFHFQLFWLGGAAKSGEEEERTVTELMNDWMMCLFVDRPWLRRVSYKISSEMQVSTELIEL